VVTRPKVRGNEWNLVIANGKKWTNVNQKKMALRRGMLVYHHRWEKEQSREQTSPGIQSFSEGKWIPEPLLVTWLYKQAYP
jgi:hypothetical protein